MGEIKSRSSWGLGLGLALAVCLVGVSPAHAAWSGDVELALPDSAVSQIATGPFTSCAVLVKGSLACAPDLRSGDLTSQSTPPNDLGAVKSVSVATNHACVLQVAGTVRCWGDNSDGQTTVPTGLAGVKQVQAAAYADGGDTASYTCVIKSDDKISCWGSSPSLGSLANSLVTQISIKKDFGCAVIKTAATVSCWGSNSNGQTTVPSGVSKVQQVAVGADHACALYTSGTTTGTVKCWGKNDASQTTVPSLVASKAKQIDLGYRHSCAVSSLDVVVCWGGGFLGVGESLLGKSKSVASQATTPNLRRVCVVNLTGQVKCSATVVSDVAGGSLVDSDFNLSAWVSPGAPVDAAPATISLMSTTSGSSCLYDGGGTPSASGALCYTGTNLSWEGAPTGAKYVWQRSRAQCYSPEDSSCQSSAPNWIDVSTSAAFNNPSSASFVLYNVATTDKGYALRLCIRAWNNNGYSPASRCSSPNLTVTGLPYGSSGTPTLNVSGKSLVPSASGVSWQTPIGSTGNKSVSLTYQWQASKVVCSSPSDPSCASSDELWDNTGASSATAAAYNLTTVPPQLVGHYLRICVIASNYNGAADARWRRCSVANGKLTGTPYVDSGDAVSSLSQLADGNPYLVADTSALQWGAATTSLRYQWQRATCSSSKSCATDAWSNISGALVASYTPGDSDTGKYLRACITGVNANGTGERVCTAAVGDLTSRPVRLSGSPVLSVSGSNISADISGMVWDNAPTSWTYRYESRICTAASYCGNTGWGLATTATAKDSTTYTPGIGDKGRYIRVCVRAINDNGESLAHCSQPNGQLTAPPELLSGALVPAVVSKGFSVSVASLSWRISPTSITYQWQRCVDEYCSDTLPTNITGATSSTYLLGTSDQSKYLRVCITPSNANGTGNPLCSAAKGEWVSTQRPFVADGSVPTLNYASLAVGVKITASLSSINWLNGPNSYTYQWSRCSTGCDVKNAPSWYKMSAATKIDYTPVAEDAGKYLRFCVVGKNAKGNSDSVCVRSATALP